MHKKNIIIKETTIKEENQEKGFDALKELEVYDPKLNLHVYEFHTVSLLEKIEANVRICLEFIE